MIAGSEAAGGIEAIASDAGSDDSPGTGGITSGADGDIAAMGDAGARRL